MRSVLNVRFADKLTKINLVELDIVIQLKRKIHGTMTLGQWVAVAIKKCSVVFSVQHHRRPAIVFCLTDERNTAFGAICYFHIERLGFSASSAERSNLHIRKATCTWWLSTPFGAIQYGLSLRMKPSHHREYVLGRP